MTTSITFVHYGTGKTGSVAVDALTFASILPLPISLQNPGKVGCTVKAGGDQLYIAETVESFRTRVAAALDTDESIEDEITEAVTDAVEHILAGMYVPDVTDLDDPSCVVTFPQGGFRWIRVDDICFVSGRFDIETVGSAFAGMRLSFPIPADLAVQIAGAAVFVPAYDPPPATPADMPASIPCFVDVLNNAVAVSGESSMAAGQNASFYISFSFSVL